MNEQTMNYQEIQSRSDSSPLGTSEEEIFSITGPSLEAHPVGNTHKQIFNLLNNRKR